MYVQYFDINNFVIVNYFEIIIRLSKCFSIVRCENPDVYNLLFQAKV